MLGGGIPESRRMSRSIVVGRPGRLPRISESKGVSPIRVASLNRDEVLATPGGYLNAELHRFAPILDILAVDQVKSGDRDRYRCMIDHVHKLSIAPVIHLRSDFERLLGRSNVRGNSPSRASGRQRDEGQDSGTCMRAPHCLVAPGGLLKVRA